MRAGGGISPPAEFADAVEMYARKYGKHATLKFIPPPVNVWAVEMSLGVNDPRNMIHQKQVGEQPTEIVYLWREATPQEIARNSGRWHRVGYKLDELGVAGITKFLDKTNLFSGRGQYSSMSEAMKDQDNKRERAEAKAVSDAREESRHVAMDMRRQILGIPLLPGGIESKQSTTPKSASTKE